jgi:Phosphotransferase enzyme family
MTPRVQADVRASLRQFGFLPAWLAAAADPERIGAALVRHEPQLALGRVTAKRLRLNRREGTWTGRYEVTVAGQDGVARALALLGTLYPPAAVPASDSSLATSFGSPGWRRVIPELGLELTGAPADEASLPVLPVLTDPARARVLLQQQLRAAAPAYADLRLAGCTPRVVRSKPGNRCTILYDLVYPPGADGPRLVVAKAYRGDKGRNAWDGMRALWASSLAAGDVVTIAEPLAYVPELGLLVQGPVGERQTLKQLIRAALTAGTSDAQKELDSAMDRTAAGLAALHTCAADYGEPVTIAGELLEIRGMLRPLTAAVPDLADAATPLLATVEELATRQPPDAAGPAHGSFRPAQVLLDGDRVAFIDFDDVCQAEPAMDLALFMSSVKGVGLVDARGGTAAGPTVAERRLAQLERLCARFLDRYQTLAPVSGERVALWETLMLLSDLVQTWTKVEPTKVTPALLLLERHLEVSGLAQSVP